MQKSRKKYAAESFRRLKQASESDKDERLARRAEVDRLQQRLTLNQQRWRTHGA